MIYFDCSPGDLVIRHPQHEGLEDLVPGHDLAALLAQDFANERGETLYPPQNFQHFPSQNIFDKEVMEEMLGRMDEEHAEQDQVTIEKKQFDDILLENYLKSSMQNSNQLASMFVEEDNEGRGARALGEQLQVNLDNTLGDTPNDDKMVQLAPHNATIYIPVERMEQIGVGDTTVRSNMVMGDIGDFVHYMPSPSLSTHPILRIPRIETNIPLTKKLSFGGDNHEYTNVTYPKNNHNFQKFSSKICPFRRDIKPTI